MYLTSVWILPSHYGARRWVENDQQDRSKCLPSRPLPIQPATLLVGRSGMVRCFIGNRHNAGRQVRLTELNNSFAWKHYETYPLQITDEQTTPHEPGYPCQITKYSDYHLGRLMAEMLYGARDRDNYTHLQSWIFSLRDIHKSLSS